ncbi:MAG: UvrD-helicase domain-containing protein [Bacillota bacterium]|jgi:ATP-dependent helicase/nuclease subunit A
MIPEPNPMQWEAIRRADRHTLVAAGAGTGKTTTVVGRILWLLGAGIRGERRETAIGLRDIGAITYTNAAAADLKRKLRTALRESGLQSVAHEVDNARIGTIHSFCGDILREFALRAGRDPGLRILEEGEAGAVADEVVHETMLAALEDGTVAGLQDLLSVWSVDDVAGWTRRLVGDGDRLLRIAQQSPAAGSGEAAVITLARHALVRLNDRLADTGAVDFDRMIVWTRDLLRQEPSVRRALQRRLHTLIVDEFQDVDPVQREIAYLLGEPEKGDSRTTRLMLVGDPKQSIYRFRRADVTVWSAVERDFRQVGWGDVVTLEDNFRSTAPILGFVDATVGTALDAPLDGEALSDFEVPFRPVRSTRPDPGGPVVELLVLAPDGEGAAPLAADGRVQEAEAVARRLTELAATGLRWKDVALLFASWSDVAIYEDALARARIPTYALRQEGFWERREVLDLILALEAVRDPRDDRALFGWLRSPFVGVRDETLLAIARGSVAPYWHSLTAVECAERELVAWGASLLAEHVALRDRVPTAELIESVLERSGYLAYLSLGGDAGLQAIANLRKLARMARQAPEQGVGDYLRVFHESRERGDREGDARLYGERDDVVTITSVHSAKGLEWPVVFWCDTGRAPGGHGGDAKLIVGRDRIALKDPDADGPGNQPLHYQVLASAEEQESAAERKRVWYVAATRARDRLIVSGLCPARKPETKSPAGAVLAALQTVPQVDGGTFTYAARDGSEFTGVVRLAPALEEEPPLPPLAEAEPALPEARAELVVPPGRVRHSATELMEWERCGRRHWFRYIAGLAEPEVDRGGESYLSAVARGQIVHDVLEHHGDGTVEQLLEAAIGRWDPDAPTPDELAGRPYRDELSGEISAVVDDPAYRVLADTPGAQRELAFLQLLSPDACVEGRIDLAAPADGGTVLLDVKTTQCAADEAPGIAARYSLQRDTYLRAVEALSGEPVTRFAFQFSAARTQVSEDVTDAMRAGAARRLDAILAAMRQGEAPLTRFPTECRFCGYHRVGWCAGVGEEAS